MYVEMCVKVLYLQIFVFARMLVSISVGLFVVLYVVLLLVWF